MAKLANKVPFSLYPLDPRFVPAKPIQEAPLSKVRALEAAGKLTITRKRDGYCHLVSRATSNVGIYTRGIEDTTARYPHIVEAVRALETKNTLLATEILFDRDGADDFAAFARIAKSNPDRAYRLQDQDGWASCMVFDIIARNGRMMTCEPFSNRLDALQDLFRYDFEGLFLAPIIDGSFDYAQQEVARLHWEGLVLYDNDAPTAYRCDGKTDQPVRPEGIWKWKPICEDDFFVERFECGEGKRASWMKELHLCQLDPWTGKKVDCGKVGTGFSNAERQELAKARYPLVVQVAFEKRFESGKLRSPRFLRLRDDKRPEECVLPIRGKE
jgi:ATP-dependent DNA ligase